MSDCLRKGKMKLVETVEDNHNVSRGKPSEQHTLDKLPRELMELIISRLCLKDNICASVVCKSWLSIAISVRVVDRVPWIMVFPVSGDTYEFFDPYQDKKYFRELPELHGSRFCCAKDDWLLMCNPQTEHVFFFHPYTRDLIKLPNFELTCDGVAFSAPPTSPNCMICAVEYISSKVVRISTFRFGSSEWTTTDYEQNRPIHDWRSMMWVDRLVFCKGLFYWWSCMGPVGVYDPDNRTWDVKSLPDCKEKKFRWNSEFVIEHNGDLFFVLVSTAVSPCIRKLDWTNKEWVDIKSLGGMSLFAGYLSSFARTDLPGKMRNSVCLSNVLSSGERCSWFTLINDICRPERQVYDWKKQKPFSSIWIEPPDDVSIFL